ncbi:unnamed protein product [Cyclocybe aegerita]|uniref:F-box domain-containing protein n=1 Tax=Cyclocybe aegerita TaxID=1973307 RepID=A0A8S0Y0L8_CYCAE|nr:unnamed protein product [Cyclocybe aegerita]
MSSRSLLKMANRTLLPLDILYTVAEILAGRSDMDSLKTSSLACRDFRRICEKHIFAEVDLTPGDRSLVDQFKKLLDIKPEAAALVQDVRLFLDPPYSANLPTVLSSMKAIRRLSLGVRKPTPYEPQHSPTSKYELSTTFRSQK